MACLAACFLLSVVLGAAVAIEIWPPVHPADTRITFGRPARPGKLPFMAFILSEAPKIAPRPCGGSLITKYAVLTSAWCVYEHETYTVRLGSIYRTEEDRNAWTAVSIWKQVHPYYKYPNLTHDIAIIYLPAEAPLSGYIQLVDLPSPNAGSFIGHRGIVSGWGHTSPGSGLSEILNWAEVVVIPTKICREFIREYVVINDGSMCAGAATSTVYLSDFGGPLVLKTKTGYLQIGKFCTYSFPSYNKSEPALFNKLTYYVDWIRLNTGPDNYSLGGMR